MRSLRGHWTKVSLLIAAPLALSVSIHSLLWQSGPSLFSGASLSENRRPPLPAPHPQPQIQEFKSRTLRVGSHVRVGVFAFSPDGKTLATGIAQQAANSSKVNGSAVQLWDVQTEKLRRVITVAGPERVSSVMFSPDSKLLAVLSSKNCGGGTAVFCAHIKLWNARTGRLKRTSPTIEDAQELVAFLPKDKILVCRGGEFPQLQAWNTCTWKTSWFIHLGIGNPFYAYCPGRQLLALWPSPAGVELASARTGAMLRPLITSLLGKIALGSLAFSPDGKLLASTCSDGAIRLWDGTTGKLQGTLTGSDTWMAPLVFSPDGKLLVSRGDWQDDKSLRVWNTASGKLRMLTGHQGSFAFMPDSKTFAIGSSDGTVKLWRIR